MSKKKLIEMSESEIFDYMRSVVMERDWAGTDQAAMLPLIFAHMFHRIINEMGEELICDTSEEVGDGGISVTQNEETGAIDIEMKAPVSAHVDEQPMTHNLPFKKKGRRR